MSVAWKEREEEEKIAERSKVFKNIKDMVSYLAAQNSIRLKHKRLRKLLIFFSFKTELVTHHFYFAHFNYAVATDKKEYPPCELAVVKYSLSGGIVQHLHEFVDPGTKKNLTNFCFWDFLFSILFYKDKSQLVMVMKQCVMPKKLIKFLQLDLHSTMQTIRRLPIPSRACSANRYFALQSLLECFQYYISF